MTALISIIVPAYNMEEYLEKCIASLLAQTYTNIEIVIVDDGSTDNTWKLCEIFQSNHSNILAIHQVNGGAASARNKGIDAAAGEYLMFVDADDYVEPDICERLINALVENNAGCAMCGFDHVDSTGKQIKAMCSNKLEIITGIEGVRNMYLSGRDYYRFVEPVVKLHKRVNWENIRFKDGLYYEDLQVMPYLFSKIDKVVIIPYIGYHYLQRAGSASHGVGTDDKRVTDSVLIRSEHADFFDQIGEFEIRDRVIGLLLELIITCDINGWTPYAEINKYRKIFRDNWNRVNKKLLPKKLRIKYDMYDTFGVLPMKMYKKVRK